MVDHATALDAQAERLAAAKLKQAQREQGIRAQAFGEGRKAERTEMLATVGAKAMEDLALASKLKEQHQAELERSARIISRGAHRDGVLQGIVIGMLAAIAIAFSTWIILREVVITNVATERVPRSAVPTLQDDYQEPGYELHPREPRSAQ
jgi:hypothetical protein